MRERLLFEIKIMTWHTKINDMTYKLWHENLRLLLIYILVKFLKYGNNYRSLYNNNKLYKNKNTIITNII